MREKLKIAIDTPWKLTIELCMYVIRPFVMIYLTMCGVKIGTGSKFYGFPKIYRHRKSKIIIGDNFECRSWWFSNPLGINHPTILSTWEEGSVLKIGNNVGISGGAIIASVDINIGDRVLIGANSTIIDSNFHPVEKGDKRYKKDNIKKSPVVIEEDSFIGTGVIILKGSYLSKDSVVPAGTVVREGNTQKLSTSRKHS